MPQVVVNINICDSTYLKNPLDTALGKRILYHSIMLFKEIGFEDFNFKKLAKAMGSTEASVYRYFENKYKLLSYLVAWYWDYLHYIILLDTRNINDAREKLRIIVSILVNATGLKTVPEYIDMPALHVVVIENASKVYHNKQVDALQEEGFYSNLKKLVKTISETIRQVDNSYTYPVALANTIIDMSLNMEYNMIHFPSLTDLKSNQSKNPRLATIETLEYTLDRLLYPGL